jgi:small subunit ribosomal protein S2
MLLSEVSVKELLEAGIHYGHRTSRWNPKMKPYIYGKRKLIHILDIRETLKGLLTACQFIEKLVAQGKDVVFVGTKRQAQMVVKTAAERCGMHYVSERWIGGSLTNFDVIRTRVKRFDELEALEQSGDIDKYSKKEGAALRRELDKIRHNLTGIRRMTRLPGALIVVDPKREKIAIAEAMNKGVATVCLADTDCNPDVVDVLVPGNDDAIRSIQLVLGKLADAVLAGIQKRPVGMEVAPPPPKVEMPPAERGPRRRERHEREEAVAAPHRARAPEAPPAQQRQRGGRGQQRRGPRQERVRPEEPKTEASEAVAPAEAPKSEPAKKESPKPAD